MRCLQIELNSKMVPKCYFNFSLFRSIRIIITAPDSSIFRFALKERYFHLSDQARSLRLFPLSLQSSLEAESHMTDRLGV